jgi:hypothetical protein
MAPKIRLKQLSGSYTVCQLAIDAPVPQWADGPGFVSIGRTEDELSVVCLHDRVPPDIKQDAGWSCIKLQGPFAFNETGIALSVIRPLSEKDVPVFLISTFDTDYLLLKTSDIPRARALLEAAGHSFT